MTANCAIHFVSDAFRSNDNRVFGRERANLGFLRAFVKYSGVEQFYCCSPSPSDFDTFRDLVGEYGSHTPAHWISYNQLADLRHAGCLFQPDPVIGDLAWHRLRLGTREVSLCGVTHTLCSGPIMDAIGNLVVAPVEHWDAVVCTSQSAKSVVEQVLVSYCDYLQARFGTPISHRVELPVIPFGVDCEAFLADRERDAWRTEVRDQLGMKTDDVAILYVGRMSYHAKSHPFPMYTALQHLTQQTNTPVHMMHFGWFADRGQREAFRQAAAQLCPNVTVHFLDQRQDWSQKVWCAADIFMSLADNVQETFGLTPIEAMAAGLPQVVSDWDGYRETVRHGVDGFRVPTAMASLPSGEELAARYAAGLDTYDQYVGNISQCVSVDVESCVAALRKLVESRSLRMSMGAEARRRACEKFDWPKIIHAYQELWLELRARRASVEHQDHHAPRQHPLREDPFLVFADYPTCALDQNCVVDLGPNAARGHLEPLMAMAMNHFAGQILSTPRELFDLLAAIADEAPILVGDLLKLVLPKNRVHALRSLAWLAKMDAIRIDGINTGLRV